MNSLAQPNLFKFATSELSQDAFICWLLSWADPKYQHVDTNLHLCGKYLIKAFFNKHDNPLSVAIEKVEVRKQDSYIDVLCIVNEQFAIIIEDKTQTTSHGTQLADYLAKIEKRSFDKENIFPIYFKTYDQGSYSHVEANQYKVFSREDFQSILDEGHRMGINNAIFQDFRLHLKGIEDRVQSYLEPNVGKWHSQAWTGFYMALQKNLNPGQLTGNWKKVNNKSGGFMGFWWGVSCKPYLLLAHEKLCFKMDAKNLNPNHPKKDRDDWCKYLRESNTSLGLNLDFKKVRFSKKAKAKTLLIIDKDYRNFDPQGRIDIAATIAYLKQVEELVKKAQELSNNSECLPNK